LGEPEWTESTKVYGAQRSEPEWTKSTKVYGAQRSEPEWTKSTKVYGAQRSEPEWTKSTKVYEAQRSEPEWTKSTKVFGAQRSEPEWTKSTKVQRSELRMQTARYEEAAAFRPLSKPPELIGCWPNASSPLTRSLLARFLNGCVVDEYPHRDQSS